MLGRWCLLEDSRSCYHIKEGRMSEYSDPCDAIMNPTDNIKPVRGER